MEEKIADQYYTNKPTSKSEEKEIEYYIADKKYKFITDNGVFSKDHVDIATNIMLNVLLKEQISRKGSRCWLWLWTNWNCNWGLF